MNPGTEEATLAERLTYDDGVSLRRAPGLTMVMDTPKGRGIVAARNIQARSVVEISPVLVMPLEDLDAVKSTTLNHYTYNWPVVGQDGSTACQTQAMALGLGSLFNHSTLNQNVGWERDLVAQCITYRALRDIKAGEELCINYGRLWFVDADEEQLNEDEEESIEILSRIQTW